MWQLWSDVKEIHGSALDFSPSLCPVVWLSALLTKTGRHPNCGPGALEGIISLLPAELANRLYKVATVNVTWGNASSHSWPQGVET